MTMEQKDETLNKPVMVYYCRCGKSIECVGDPKYIVLSKRSSKEYRKMEQAGRKVETMTKGEFLKLPFLCNGVEECPDKQNTLGAANNMNWDED